MSEQLDELKQIELEILREFIKVCDALNLRYYVLGGTLLGAIRHNGFIPWDDDIDVGMPREDYEKFLRYGQEYLPSKMFLQTYITDPEYCVNFAKIRNSQTTFVESSMKKCRINHGVYIDIFPLDYYRMDVGPLFKIKKMLLTLRITDIFCAKGMKTRTKLVRYLARIVYPSIKNAVRKRDELYKSVGQGTYLANHSGAWGSKEIVPQEWYGDGVSVCFEGMTVMAPAKYHEWLKQVYGNYMELPPVEKRVGHHYVDIIDLKAPYTKYINEK